MVLKRECKVRSVYLDQELEIVRNIGEGGEGIAYLVKSPDGIEEVVKWYHRSRIVPGHKQGIVDLVRRGPPRGAGGKRFVWPKDLVEPQEGDGLYGYRMDLIPTERFVELPKIWAGRHPRPSYKRLCEISFKIADSFSDLHLGGYCYKDISLGNLLIDSIDGEVLICDNDNVGVESEESVILGTAEFMAPEVVCGNAPPSTSTDKHSLAVLLFYLWMWHHPLEGEKEYKIRCWDAPAKKKLYGEEPLFVFDPYDKSNGLIDASGYRDCLEMWQACPGNLQEAFLKTFTRGLKYPNSRVTEGRWKSIFRSLGDNIVTCRCGAELLWSEGSEIVCWNCKERNPAPLRLIIETRGGTTELLFRDDLCILARHIELDDEKEEQVVATIIPHPEKKGVYGLRNETQRDWRIENDQGGAKPVPYGKSVRLSRGMNLDLGRGVNIRVKE